MGYRFDFAQKFIVTERGGIYVYSSMPGTRIYINDSLEETTGIFNREYLSQSTKPGRYLVRAENDGYRSWEKYIEVEPQKVSSVYPFLVLSDFSFEEVPEFIAESTSATTTKEVSNDLYAQYLDLFTPQKVATSTIDELVEKKPDIIKRVFGDVQVWYGDQKFYAEWLARGDYLPAYFCENGECLNPLVFLEVNSAVKHFNFYPGRDDVIIFGVESGGVYLVEVDKRPPQTVVQIYQGTENVDFRISGRDTLVIKDGDKIITTKLTK